MNNVNAEGTKRTWKERPEPETLYSTPYDYDTHPFWRHRPLTPAQLLVHDIRLETWRADGIPKLEITERSTASLIPEPGTNGPDIDFSRANNATDVPIEKQSLVSLEEDYGWMRHLRLSKHQSIASENETNTAKCRWIHCYSRFPEYLRGFLWAFSKDGSKAVDALRLLEHAIQHNTRFSKHGKYFNPFFQNLSSRTPTERITDQDFPLLLSIPFLDWTVLDETPALRFQVDKREAFASTRSSAHMLRSILQYFYRLEDTRNREKSQVFAKHKPWTTDRHLDLTIRQWYGHYPSGLNVDELWVLAIDSDHIVTMSSNQTWKSRWPPLQLASRISDVTFRDLRNQFARLPNEDNYTAAVHVVACISGAVGMMHRTFWPDMVLPLTDRYAGHFSRLQYRLHRSPSTKLVMDLIACQEELNIVIQITEQQLRLISELEETLITPYSNAASHAMVDDIDGAALNRAIPTGLRRGNVRSFPGMMHPDPLVQIIENLRRELVDLQELRDSTDRLVNRTIQLVNIRLEDHGKAILVFTVVTIIFLPLNFVSSFFGMNVSDIRNISQTQSLFWLVAVCVTLGVLAASMFLAFYGGRLLERFAMWRDKYSTRRAPQSSSFTSLNNPLTLPARGSFRVYGVSGRNNTFRV